MGVGEGSALSSEGGWHIGRGKCGQSSKSIRINVKTVHASCLSDLPSYTAN